MNAANQAQRARRSLRRYLLDDERIVLATRHHWARLLEPALTAAAAFIVLMVMVELAGSVLGDRAAALWWLWLIPLARPVRRLIEWYFEWFVGTDKRMLLVTGVITHRVAMMPLHKVTDMSYSRSLLGQVLGYGEFVLESAGADQVMRRIGWVPRPDESYRTLCATIFTPPPGKDQACPLEHQPASGVRRSWPGAAVEPQVVEGPVAGRGPVPAPSTRPVPVRQSQRPGPDVSDVPGVRGPVWDVSEPTGRFVPVDGPVIRRSDEDCGGPLT